MGSTLFPPPGPVLDRARVLIEDGLLQESMIASLRRILQASCMGSAIGIPLGLAIGSFRPPGCCWNPGRSSSASSPRWR